MTLGIADGLRLLLKYPLRNLGFPGRELLFSNMGTAVVGAVCAVIISTVSIYGVIRAGNIHTTKMCIRDSHYVRTDGCICNICYEIQDEKTADEHGSYPKSVSWYAGNDRCIFYFEIL